MTKPTTRMNAFTLTESLCALMCALMVFGLCSQLLLGASNLVLSRRDYQDEFAILQMRQLCASCDQIRIEDNCLYLSTAGSGFQLEFHKNRIVRRDGYIIYLEGVEGGQFYEQNGIYLSFIKNGKQKIYQIA